MNRRRVVLAAFLAAGVGVFGWMRARVPIGGSCRAADESVTGHATDSELAGGRRVSPAQPKNAPAHDGSLVAVVRNESPEAVVDVEVICERELNRESSEAGVRSRLMAPNSTERVAVRRTGTDGTVRFEGLDRGAPYSLRANPSPTAAGSKAWDWAQTKPTPSVLYVRPGAWLGGRVLDADGRPVQGAIVTTEWMGQRSRDGWSETERRNHWACDGTFSSISLLTPADGHFRFDAAPIGLHSVTVLTPGRQERGGFLVRSPGSDVVLQLSAVGTASIDVFVHDSERKPVAGAGVSIEGSLVPKVDRGSVRFEATTDEHGLARFEHLPRFIVEQTRVEADRYDEWTSGESHRLASDEHWLIDVSLAEVGGIEGVVLDWKDGPVEGARVIAREGDDDRRSEETGADGRFKIPSVPYGERELELQCPAGYAAAGSSRDGESRPIGAREGVTVRLSQSTPRVDVTLRARPTLALVGKVVDEMGTPVWGAEVNAYHAEPRTSGSASTLARTRSDGRFAVGPDPEGGWPSIYARDEGGGLAIHRQAFNREPNGR